MSPAEISKKMHSVVDIAARTNVPAATTINVSELADLLIAAEQLNRVEQLLEEWIKRGQAGDAHFAERASELGELIGR